MCSQVCTAQQTRGGGERGVRQGSGLTMTGWCNFADGDDKSVKVYVVALLRRTHNHRQPHITTLSLSAPASCRGERQAAVTTLTNGCDASLVEYTASSVRRGTISNPLYCYVDRLYIPEDMYVPVSPVAIVATTHRRDSQCCQDCGLADCSQHKS